MHDREKNENILFERSPLTSSTSSGRLVSIEWHKDDIKNKYKRILIKTGETFVYLILFLQDFSEKQFPFSTAIYFFRFTSYFAFRTFDSIFLKIVSFLLSFRPFFIIKTLVLYCQEINIIQNA